MEYMEFTENIYVTLRNKYLTLRNDTYIIIT